MARKTHTGTYYVGDDPRRFESPDAALSLALRVAESRPKEMTGAVYVRCIGAQGAIACAERVGDVVITRRIIKRG